MSIKVEILPLTQHLFGSFPPALLSDGAQEMTVALLPEKSRNSPNVKQSSEPNDLWLALRIFGAELLMLLLAEYFLYAYLCLIGSSQKSDS